MSETAELTHVGMTTAAARQVNKVLAREAQGSCLRIAVNGGGCSGFQYAFDIVQHIESDDVVIERDGATVVVDPVSLEYMRGSRIDFVDDLIGQAFKIENPNATASCGCGTSFAL